MLNKNFKLSLFLILLIFFTISSFNFSKFLDTANISFNFKNSNNIIEKPKEIKLLFVGDIMMTRYVEKKINILKKDPSFLFENIANYLKSFDYIVANLEGPISNKGIKVGSKYSFRMKPEVVFALNKANIKIVNLANNHIFDYGKVAFEDTLKNLNENKIKYFGNSYEPLIIEKESIKIGE